MCRSAGTRDIIFKENIFMMLSTFNFITITGDCKYVHKIQFLETNSLDNKIIKINCIRNTSSYECGEAS